MSQERVPLRRSMRLCSARTLSDVSKPQPMTTRSRRLSAALKEETEHNLATKELHLTPENSEITKIADQCITEISTEEELAEETQSYLSEGTTKEKANSIHNLSPVEEIQETESLTAVDQESSRHDIIQNSEGSLLPEQSIDDTNILKDCNTNNSVQQDANDNYTTSPKSPYEKPSDIKSDLAEPTRMISVSGSISSTEVTTEKVVVTNLKKRLLEATIQERTNNLTENIVESVEVLNEKTTNLSNHQHQTTKTVDENKLVPFSEIAVDTPDTDNKKQNECKDVETLFEAESVSTTEKIVFTNLKKKLLEAVNGERTNNLTEGNIVESVVDATSNDILSKVEVLSEEATNLLNQHDHSSDTVKTVVDKSNNLPLNEIAVDTPDTDNKKENEHKNVETVFESENMVLSSSEVTAEKIVVTNLKKKLLESVTQERTNNLTENHVESVVDDMLSKVEALNEETTESSNQQDHSSDTTEIIADTSNVPLNDVAVHTPDTDNKKQNEDKNVEALFETDNLCKADAAEARISNATAEVESENEKGADKDAKIDELLSQAWDNTSEDMLSKVEALNEETTELLNEQDHSSDATETIVDTSNVPLNEVAVHTPDTDYKKQNKDKNVEALFETDNLRKADAAEARVSNTTAEVESEDEKGADIDSKIDELLSQGWDNTSDESDIEENSFIQTMAEEGEEDTPSEGSNDIVEVGEEINTTESEFSTDESYESNSFIDDEENYQLLSGEEYDLPFEKHRKKSRIIQLSSGSDDEIVHIKKPEKKVVRKRKSRIIRLEDSSDEEPVNSVVNSDLHENSKEIVLNDCANQKSNNDQIILEEETVLPNGGITIEDGNKETELENNSSEVAQKYKTLSLPLELHCIDSKDIEELVEMNGEVDEGNGGENSDGNTSDAIETSPSSLTENVTSSKKNLDKKIIILETITIQNICNKDLGSHKNLSSDMININRELVEDINNIDATQETSRNVVDNSYENDQNVVESQIHEIQKKDNEQNDKPKELALQNGVRISKKRKWRENNKKRNSKKVSLKENNVPAEETSGNVVDNSSEKDQNVVKGQIHEIQKEDNTFINDKPKELASQNGVRISKKRKRRDNNKKRKSKKVPLKENKSQSVSSIEENDSNVGMEKQKSKNDRDNEKKRKRERSDSGLCFSSIDNHASDDNDAVVKKRKKNKLKGAAREQHPIGSKMNIMDEAILGDKTQQIYSLETKLLDKEWKVRNVRMRPSQASEPGSKVKKMKAAKCSKNENSNVNKFHVKDFRNLMLYDSTRVRRMETQELIKKRKM